MSSRTYDGARVLAPTGRLDHDNADAFQAELAPHIAECIRDGTALVLDLSGVDYVSSAGLRCLMIAAKQVKSAQRRMLVAALRPVVAEIIAISRFNLVLEVFPTMREALASVSAQAAQAFDRG